MKIERNEVSPDRLKDVTAGDWVAIHLATDIGAVLFCQVVAVRDLRLRAIVHGLDGTISLDVAGCPTWDLTLPWSSIAFLRHTKTKPVVCSCGDQS